MPDIPYLFWGGPLLSVGALRIATSGGIALTRNSKRKSFERIGSHEAARHWLCKNLGCEMPPRYRVADRILLTVRLPGRKSARSVNARRAAKAMILRWWAHRARTLNPLLSQLLDKLPIWFFDEIRFSVATRWRQITT